MKSTIEEIKPEYCCGCAACLEKCPVHAISMMTDISGNMRPRIDKQKCIKCELCVKTCPQINIIEHTLNNDKLSFVGYNNNRVVANLSSSGGIFTVIAESFLKQMKGVVYGAAMTYDNDELLCKHIRIENLENLYLLQGSKYVHSRTEMVFSQVMRDLKEGRKCLFSGTSCQIAALLRITGDHSNLYTIDLVCHGVPKDNVFYKYIEYLERKINCSIVSISFRKKGVKIQGKEDTYILSLTCKNKDGSLYVKTIPHLKSAFYELFISRAGYMDSCYHCLYASANKPSDMTLGDFNPQESEVKEYNLSIDNHYSTVILNTAKGKLLLDAVNNECTLIELPICKIIPHHLNLQKPSEITDDGKYLFSIYEKGGYVKLQKYVDYCYIKSQIKYTCSKVLTTIQKRCLNNN